MRRSVTRVANSPLKNGDWLRANHALLDQYAHGEVPVPLFQPTDNRSLGLPPAENAARAHQIRRSKVLPQNAQRLKATCRLPAAARLIFGDFLAFTDPALVGTIPPRQ